MARISVLALPARFLSVVRNEGLGPAWQKAWSYTKRRLRRSLPSVLGKEFGRRSSDPKHYLDGIWQTLAKEGCFHITHKPAIIAGRRHIAMIADLNLPQCRKYRVEQLADFWRERGVEFEYAHYQDIPRAVHLMQRATHLMEYRLHSGDTSELLRYEARRLRLPVLYDIDDPLFSVSAYETYQNMDVLDPALKVHFLHEAPKYLSMMNGADALSVSTPALAAHAQAYTSRPVFLRRNFADQASLVAGSAAMQVGQPVDGLFRVAFASGSQGHEIDLKEIIDVLAAFILSDVSRRLMVLGHFDLSHLPKALGPRIERVKFTGYADYLAALARANCAVMPLCDDIFNQCKSAVRVLDAASVGVPSIVGTVGDLHNVVRPDVTGFVATGAGQWAGALRALAEDPAAGRAMGQAARRDLERRWQMSAQDHIIAPELIEWVEG